MTAYSPLPRIPSYDSDLEDEPPPLHYPKPSNELPRPQDGESDVERLETQAARMSFGRDVGKEIHRLSQELKRQDSRKSSMSRASLGHTPTEAVRRSAFSPTELVRSPEGSMRSGSDSYRRRGSRSNTRTSRPSTLPEPEQEGRPLDSPLVTSQTAGPGGGQFQHYEPAFSTWDQQLPEEAEDDEDEDAVNEGEMLLGDKEATRQALEGSVPNEGVRRGLSKSSRASTSTFKDGSMFRDFDGTHYEHSLYNFNGEQLDAASISRRASGIRPLQVPARQSMQRWAEPPPPDNMVYYPAPVPMHLNLPKRLSQQVPVDTHAKRRSNFMSQMNDDTSRSVIWPKGNDNQEEEQSNPPASPPLPPPVEPSHTQNQSSYHRSRGSMQNLPPQLRASVFFHHDSVPHELKIKRGSAIATLDDFLDAAATAPIGEAPRSSSNMKKHKARRSTMGSIGGTIAGMSRISGNRSSVDTTGYMRNKSRLSSNYDDEERDTLGPLNRASSAPMFNDNPQQSSRRAFYSEPDLEEEEEELSGEDYENQEHDEESQRTDEEHDYYEDSESEEENDKEPEPAKAETQDEPRPFAPPSTLLAELQLRKQELRSRNRTAATAFPNGMHSTLLELDAVAQIEKKKRMNARTTLAWEDTNPTRQPQHNDDDVPLGMLFPEKNSLVGKRATEDWDRPLGLIQQRDMEDNEPLSRRRNRLRGVSPERARPHTSHMSQAVPTVAHATKEEEGDSSEHEEETLAQRTRRLKSQKALDDAIGGEVARSRPVSSDFKTEILSQFGGLDEEKPKEDEPEVKIEEKPTGPVEETLGQRRKRLQAEAMVNNPNPPNLPPLRASGSLANLLATNPLTGTRLPSSENKASMAGLVGQSEQQQASRRQQLYQQNQLSSNNLLGGPLVSLPADIHSNIGQKKRPGFAGGQFNDGTAGAGSRQTLLPRQSAANFQENLMNPMPGMLQQQQMPQMPQMQMPMSGGMGMNMAAPPMGLQSNAQFGMQMGAPQGIPNTGGFNNGIPSLYQQQLFFQQQQNRQTGTFPQMQIPEGYAAPGMYPAFNQGTMAFNIMKANMNNAQQAANMSPSQRDNIDRWRQTIMPLD